MYNHDLLMCRPDFFEIAYQINPYMDLSKQPDREILKAEYAQIVAAHIAAGRTIRFMEPVDGLPDMTYTANQALIRGKKAVLANLPKERAGELQYVREWLISNGYEVFDCPYLLSGQGDALPTGTGAVIKGRGWRSDPKSDRFVEEKLGYEIIPIQTKGPEWYDNDLVFGILKPGLIAVCFEALDEPSQKLIRARQDLKTLEVSLGEAEKGACNLVSDGTTVTMMDGAPKLAANLRELGFTVVELPITQLWLGGGGIRCTTLALDAN
jgi:N-dimethylarginine dimethylaminohydrolase